MNPTQILLNQLQMQLKSRNPKLFEQFKQMQNQNPQEVLNQLIKPEQKEQFIKYASNFGINEEWLNNLGINRNV